jgi:Flp pilus assembly pilin Flp
LVEYSLALVLIGLAAVLVIGFVGRSTSDAFDEVGDAFPEASPALSADQVPPPGVFSELRSLVDDLNGPGKSLIGKVDDAESSYLEGDLPGARSKLVSLLKEVDAQDGNKLTSDEAAAVRAAVQRLVDNLGPG